MAGETLLTIICYVCLSKCELHKVTLSKRFPFLFLLKKTEPSKEPQSKSNMRRTKKQNLLDQGTRN